MKRGIVIVSIFAVLAAIITAWIVYENREQTVNIIIPKENFQSAGRLIKQFGKENNIKVNVMRDVYFGNIDRLSLAINGFSKTEDIPPDIYYIINDWLEDAVKAGIVSEVKESDLSEIAEIPKNGIKFDGKYYGYPFTWETQALFINPEYVTKIPVNIDEMISEAKRIDLQFKGVRGLSFPESGYFTFPFHTLFGGSILTAKNCTSPESKEIFKKEFKFLKSNMDYKSKDGEDIFNFQNGTVAMMIQGSWILNSLKESGCKYKVAPLPDNRMKRFIGVKSLIISPKSRNKKGAEKIAKYLASEKFQRELMKSDEYIPTNRAVLSDTQNDNITMILKSSDNGILLPYSSQMNEYWYKSELLLKGALKKERDVDKTVDIILRGE